MPRLGNLEGAVDHLSLIAFYKIEDLSLLHPKELLVLPPLSFRRSIELNCQD